MYEYAPTVVMVSVLDIVLAVVCDDPTCVVLPSAVLTRKIEITNGPPA